MITAVIPVRNGALTLARAIDSILAQDGPFEVVVIDGASTDGTQAVLRTYEDRIRWISEPDAGQTEAINKGMAMASGEVLCWVNGDDWLVPGAFRRVRDCFMENPDAGCCYGDILFENSVNGETLLREEPQFSSFVMLYGHNLFADPSFFLRRSVWQAVGPLDIDVRWSMDYDLWLRAHDAGFRFKRVQSPLAVFLIGKANASLENRGALRIEHFEILARRRRFLRALPRGVRHLVLVAGLYIARAWKVILCYREGRGLRWGSFSRMARRR